MKKILSNSAVLFSSLLLIAACGGGGGGNNNVDGDKNPLPNEAEGAYEGFLVSDVGDFSISSIILENGQYYTLYGVSANDGFYIHGVVEGTGKSKDGIFTSTNLKDFTFDGLGVPGTLSASYTPGVSFNGSALVGGQKATFTTNAFEPSVYDYNAPANLASVTGAWNMETLQGESLSLNIKADGSFSASSSGCLINGSILPRPTNKNVFDVKLKFGPAPCALPNQTASGIGLETPLAGGRQQLTMAGTDSARKNGTVMFGSR